MGNICTQINSVLFRKVIYRKYVCDDCTLMIVYNLNNHVSAILDDLSAVLFEELAVNTRENIEKIMAINSLTPEDISDFIDDLIKSGVLNSEADNDKLSGQERNDEENIAEFENFYNKIYENGYLFSIHIDVTNQCNLRCIHCYHPFNEYTFSNNLTLNEIKKVVDEAYSLGVLRVTISGGEPFMRDDIYDILDYISKKGMIIDLFTNATLINDDVVKRLERYNIKEVGISVYSVRPDIHEAITNFHSYNNTYYAIQKLREDNFEVKLKCILMKENIKYYRELIDFSREIGCSIVLDFEITPKLNGDISPTKLALDFDDVINLSLDNSTKFYALTPQELSYENSPCNAGKYSLYISSTGNIYPCVSLQVNLGNIRHNSLIDIWENNKELHMWQKIKNRDFLGFGENTYCKYCMGICAGLAQLENGKYNKCPKSSCYKAKAREKAHKKIMGE